jgi:hypothetical protein
LLALLLAHGALYGQNAKTFARAVRSGHVQRVDRWVKREVHRHRDRVAIDTPNGSYGSYAPTYDSLAAFMRRQPGVLDATWDRCIGKIDIWPGHSNIGMRWRQGDEMRERCWKIREGIPGTINFPGWRPHVRKDRERLKYLRAMDCPGFVAEQRRWCDQHNP